MRVAALQMCSSIEPGTNIEQARALITQAAQAGAELLVLPEYFCIMGRRDADKLQIQEQDGSGKLQAFLAEQAKMHGVYLIGGTIPIQGSDASHARNSCLVYAPSGERVARYDKIHLFSFHKGRESYNEANTLERGDTPVTFDLPSRDGHTWRVGLSICYDLRFPELFRQLQADLIVLPAAFTYTTGLAHWEVLLRARAIENLAFVLASAQGGTHENERATWGHSMAIDPWGKVLAVAPPEAQSATIVYADLEWEHMQLLRAQLPALRHKVLSV